MEKEHDLWLTHFFNTYLPGFGNAILSLFHVVPGNRAHPWENFIVMQIMVVAIVVVLFAYLRSQLSVEAPSKLQLTFEPIFGTLFIFILFSNLIGIVPGLESPTQIVYVPCGCALLAVLYYNVQGIYEHRHRYIKQFLGPKWWLAPLLFPIEIATHLARPLSLTVRLYANMLAGEKLTVIFLSLTYFIGPVAFMGLHAFVSLVQAYVFAMLATVYVAAAVSHEAH